jgi:hypothetical protein
MEMDILPVLGSRPIAGIEAPELVAMSKAIEDRGARDIAKRALETAGQVFRYAIAHGHARHNPNIWRSRALPSSDSSNFFASAKWTLITARRIEMRQPTRSW